MTLRARQDHRGLVGKIARPLARAHDDRGRAVGLQAAVVEAERLRHPARVEVLAHRQGSAAHQRPLVQLRVRSEGHRDLAGVGVARPVELLVPHCDPRIELRGGTRSVRQVVVEHDVADRAGVHPASGAGYAFTRPERRVSVPSDDDEHVARYPRGDRQRRVLQRRHGTRAAHVHRGREPQRVDAEVRGQLFARRVSGRWDDPVDIGRGEPRVGDRGVGGLQDQLDGQERRAAHVVGFADPDDRRLPADAEARSVAVHETRTLPVGCPRPAKQERPSPRCEGRSRLLMPEVRSRANLSHHRPSRPKA